MYKNLFNHNNRRNPHHLSIYIIPYLHFPGKNKQEHESYTSTLETNHSLSPHKNDLKKCSLSLIKYFGPQMEKMVKN